MTVTANGTGILGQRLKMRGGDERARGAARYASDVVLPGMLHARPVLSDHAHAVVRGVRTEAALAVPGVVAVLTAQDLAVRFAPMTRAHMLLAQGRVVFSGQPIAVVVAESASAAMRAAPLVEVDYEPLSASIDAAAALLPDAPRVWPNGVPKTINPDDAAHGATAAGAKPIQEQSSNQSAEASFTRGDVEAGFRQADVVVENTYRAGFVHHGYLETNSSVAQPDPVSGGITLYSSTQAAFLVRDKVAQVLGIPAGLVRVVTPAVGGAFGGKFGTFEPLVAAVAWTLKRPVSMVLTRSEDFRSATPGHATVIRVKSGMTRDGVLTAVEAEVTVDNGTHPTGLHGLTAQVLGACYRVPNLSIRAVGVLTHKAAVGAYRGPGGPQASFAMESQIDEMARQLGLDPIEVRLKNAVEEGDPLADNRRYPKVGLKSCLERLASHPLWVNRTHEPGIGYGVAIGGWVGSILPASALCSLDADGTLIVQVASQDITGTNTVMALIAAGVFNMPPEMVRVYSGDTGCGVFAGPSGGSMTTRTVGAAVLSAAESARERLVETAAGMLEADAGDLILENGAVQVRGVPGRQVTFKEIGTKTQSYSSPYPPVCGEGSVALTEIAPCFVVQLARVKVDSETGTIRVLDWVVVQDVGHALDPLLIEGQVHGALAQGQGWALGEELVYDASGQLITGSFMDYPMPRADSLPSIDVQLVEVPAAGSPFGARGVAEPSILPATAAISNAVRDACGVRATSMPIRPEAIWRHLANAH